MNTYCGLIPTSWLPLCGRYDVASSRCPLRGRCQTCLYDYASRWPIGCTTSVIRLTSRSKRDSQLNAAARETIKSGNDDDVMGSIHSRWGMNLFIRRSNAEKRAGVISSLVVHVSRKGAV